MPDLDTRLEGKVAIVTGASGTGRGDLWGNGEAIAIMFARQGAKVLLVSRNRKNAENVLSEIKREGGEASFFAVDLGLFGNPPIADGSIVTLVPFCFVSPVSADSVISARKGSN